MATNPAMKVRITKSAIDYANSVAQAELEKELRNIHIPEQSGDDHHLSWSFKDIRNPDITIPSSAIRLEPSQNGLSWTLSDMSMELKSDWRVQYKRGRLLKIRDSGSVQVKIRHVTASVTIALGKDETNRPSIRTASCNADIGGVNIDFHGGTSFIWNLFSGILERKLKSILHDKICDVVSREVNEGAAGKLAKCKVMREMHRFLLDYSLTAAPAITAEYLEVQNKGEVYWKNAIEEAPFSPGTVPPLSDPDGGRMLYLWFTEYVFNTYLYVAHKHGYLTVNLPASGELLERVGTFIPQIGMMCQNSQLEINLVSKHTPQFKITTEGMEISVVMAIKLDEKSPTNETVNVLTINTNLCLSVIPAIENERLVGTLAKKNFRIEDVMKADGSPLNVPVDTLNFFMNVAVEVAVLPELNRIGALGFDLPMTGGIKFQNAKLSFLPGVLLLATDLLYES